MLSQTTSRPLPAIFIGKELINDRVKRFLHQKHPLLSKALSKDGAPREDTRSIWYTKEHVATWLQEMEHYNADGMRVYFGAYGDNEEGRPPGQLCLLMVLTKGEGMIHKDIIIEEEVDFEQRRENLQARSLSLGETVRPREYNYGSPCPPACSPGPTSPGKASGFPLD